MAGSDPGQVALHALQNSTNKHNNWNNPYDVCGAVGLDDVEALIYGLLSLTLPAVDPYTLSQPKSSILDCVPGAAPSYSTTIWDDPPPLFSSQDSSSSVAGPDGITPVHRGQKCSRGRSRKHHGSLRGVLSDKEMPICFDFAQGRCSRTNCQYQHNVTAIVKHNSREKRVCFDYLRGECRRGKTCRFSHNIQPLVSQWLRDESAGEGMRSKSCIGTRKKKGVCYDFVRGHCGRGRKCPWTHNLVEIACATTKKNGKLSIQDINKISLATFRVLSGNCNPSRDRYRKPSVLEQLERIREIKGHSDADELEWGPLEKDLEALHGLDITDK